MMKKFVDAGGVATLRDWINGKSITTKPLTTIAAGNTNADFNVNAYSNRYYKILPIDNIEASLTINGNTYNTTVTQPFIMHGYTSITGLMAFYGGQLGEAMQLSTIYEGSVPIITPTVDVAEYAEDASNYYLERRKRFRRAVNVLDRSNY